jgi:hypothetical protein
MTYKAKQPNRNTHQSVYQENPLPPFQPALPLHRLMHRRHHQSGAHTPHLSHRRKNRRSRRNLTRLVPTPHHINRPAIHTRLRSPLQKPHHSQLRITRARRRTHRDSGPHNQTQGQPNARSDALDDEGVRDGADDGAGDEEGEEDGVLVAHEVEVFAEAGDVGVCEGGAVEVVEEVGEAAICLRIMLIIICPTFN